MIITEVEFNIETGEETITKREETAAETKARLDYAKEIAKEEAEVEAKAEAQKAILERLGLTADEAALLLG